MLLNQLFRHGLGLTAAVTLMLSQPAMAADDGAATILVFDGSGSMWAELEGRTRIEVARDVLSEYLAGRDMSRPLGVIAYGHRRRGDCADIETLFAAGVHGADEVSARLNALNPKGKTPISDALREAARQIPRTAEEADIVLITDGIETCVPDVCTIADELAESGIKIRAHVVGFGLSEAEADTLACIPGRTGGKLLRPGTGQELADALRQTETQAPAEDPSVSAEVKLLILLGNNGMPERYSWSLRNDDTGTVTELAEMTGDARYSPFPLNLDEGRYTALLSTASGSGETSFEIRDSEEKSIQVALAGDLPDITLINRGPYLAGHNALFDLTINREGLNVGGADFQLTLYKAKPNGDPDGAAITWSYVSGSAGRKANALALPPEPGEFIVTLERGDGTIVGSTRIESQADPAVRLVVPSVVTPGSEIDFESFGGQGANDLVRIQKDGADVGWALTLGSIAEGNPLKAPEEEGTYDLVYAMGDGQVEKARVSFQVSQAGTPAAQPAEKTDAQGLPQSGSQGEVEATFKVGEAFDSLQVQWSAIPLDENLPLDAWAPSDFAPSMSGSFLPGRYRVTGDAGDMQFLGDVEISAEGPNVFEIGLVTEPGSDPGGPLTEEGASELLDRLVPDRKPAN
ncbi:vWA domain-containing protein [Hoeflea alexandrii]|uniref:vWA domain-containing protein n=1 Tax=Hoeflea alexandrii TaxID=288436 RepID=UPI0022AF012A|nr:VWA domain-containing protein [Hoeflea alexandrii]MCZ4290909.1 VWA domain-containing protein [Hoeflea alexandrii]